MSSSSDKEGEKHTVLESIWGEEETKRLPDADEETIDALNKKFGHLRIGKGKCSIKIRWKEGNAHEVMYMDGTKHPARSYRLPTHVEGYKLESLGKAKHMGQAKYVLVVGLEKDEPRYSTDGLTSAMVQVRRSFSTMEKRMETDEVNPDEARAMAGDLWKTMQELRRTRGTSGAVHRHVFTREITVPLDEWMSTLPIAPAMETLEREGHHQFRKAVLNLKQNMDFDKVTVARAPVPVAEPEPEPTVIQPVLPPPPLHQPEPMSEPEPEDPREKIRKEIAEKREKVRLCEEELPGLTAFKREIKMCFIKETNIAIAHLETLL